MTGRLAGCDMLRSRQIRFLRLLLGALAVTLAAPQAAAACEGARAHPSDVPLDQIRRATLCLINKEGRSAVAAGLTRAPS